MFFFSSLAASVCFVCNLLFRWSENKHGAKGIQFSIRMICTMSESSNSIREWNAWKSERLKKSYETIYWLFAAREIFSLLFAPDTIIQWYTFAKQTSRTGERWREKTRCFARVLVADVTRVTGPFDEQQRSLSLPFDLHIMFCVSFGPVDRICTTWLHAVHPLRRATWKETAEKKV